ncbi:DUF2235 domain-containing protein [Roseobacter weihaiensis]|uniref:DUF2235 domain-containing protein n=1 Tax=Roseobacter weihaiensis TaxID=2763262 RepID=UPI001D0BAC80|nr:DUF2235 domain-containing protein [Roseobacter sp. H9]
MAVIAIFCDGTWSSLDSKDQTHVARLASACAQTKTQKVIYVEGVGTDSGRISDLGRWLSRVGGGLFGWGLNGNIRAAYLALCRLYQPGDKIMIFGFSRGAYTARSLVGMIRKCGILADPTARNARRAFRLYRARGARNAPDTRRIWRARRWLSPDYATSPQDVIWRDDHSYLVRITYLGVWDTVGALGIPKSILGRVASLWNERYAFHDTSLSRLVEQARHAVALDEKRVPYAPSLWDNLEPAGDDPGLNRGDISADRFYQQLWFPGNHAVIGGSATTQGLAAIPLVWIWQGAARAGLVATAGSPIPPVPPDAVEPAEDLYEVGALYRLLPWLVQWRRGPKDPHALHNAARLRMMMLPDYRPVSLAGLLRGLFRAG